jgi:hypothetical protein
MELAQVCINEGIDENVAYISNEILLSHKEE